MSNYISVNFLETSIKRNKIFFMDLNPCDYIVESHLEFLYYLNQITETKDS